jgi:hypothetical protein
MPFIFFISSANAFFLRDFPLVASPIAHGTATARVPFMGGENGYHGTRVVSKFC